MLKLKARPGFRAVPAALVLRDKAGLRLSEAKKVVDELSEGVSVSISLSFLGTAAERRSQEIAVALRECHVTVEEDRQAARA